MAEIIGVILLTIVSYLTFIAFLTTLVYLLPEKTRLAQQALAARPGRSFLIGLVNLLFFGILAALLSQGGELLGMLGVAILLALLAFAFIGLAGLVLILRPRFFPPHEESPHTALAVTVRTAVLLVTAMLSPIIGWFVLSPIIAVAGLGAGIRVVVQRRGGTAVQNPN
ncbi:MAG: hypothetical protein ACE5EY_05245 [Anaerolineae bacterium]